MKRPVRLSKGSLVKKSSFTILAFAYVLYAPAFASADFDFTLGGGITLSNWQALQLRGLPVLNIQVTFPQRPKMELGFRLGLAATVTSDEEEGSEAALFIIPSALCIFRFLPASRVRLNAGAGIAPGIGVADGGPSAMFLFVFPLDVDLVLIRSGNFEMALRLGGDLFLTVLDELVAVYTPRAGVCFGF